MIAGACLILGSCPSGPVGRPRKYKNRAEADRAYKLRKKEREKTREIISTPDPVKAMAVAIAETIVAAVPFERREVTEAREKLLRAARDHVDLAADVSPIFALIDQG